MKKLLLLFVATMFVASVNAQSGDLAEFTVYYGDSSPRGDSVTYFLGENTIPGYGIQSKVCPKNEVITLSNGRRLAGLSYVLMDKKDYVGGNLVFNGDITIIKSVEVYPVGNSAVFKVTGESFNMQLTLENGAILKLEDEYAVFNTENQGIWSIFK